MGFDSDQSEFARMSTKKLAILFGLAFFGAFMFIQMIQGFPLKDIFLKQEITEQVQIGIKQAGTCVVTPSDKEPREIHDCPYNIGDKLIITYAKGRAPIDSYKLAAK